MSDTLTQAPEATVDEAKTDLPVIESVTHPIPPSKALVPIESSLKEAGLINGSETITDIGASTTTATTLTTVNGTNATPPTQTIVARGGGSEGTRTHRRQMQTQTQMPGRGSRSVPAIVPRRPVEPIDPLDIPDEHNYTPRMRQWIAEPGFDVLFDILSTKRPKGSQSELGIIKKYLYPIPGITEDQIGNLVVDIGDNAAKVIWSCHTDTVHWDERGGGKQLLILNKKGVLSLDRDIERTGCLGADDGTGMWIMLEMIKAQVPGRYMFHYGEESGCIGSKWMRKNREDLLEGMRFAIAFDRAGKSDVIISQRGRRCASEAFAVSIAAQLPGHYTSSPGVYTDTAEYLDIVPECTNLSVGYQGQHGTSETQDLPHLYALRDAMCRIDASKFVCARDPKAQEVSPFRNAGSAYRGLWGGMGLYGYDEEDWDAIYGTSSTPSSVQGPKEGGTSGSYAGSEEGAEESPFREDIERVFGRTSFEQHGQGLSRKRRPRRDIHSGHGNTVQYPGDQGDRMEQDVQGAERELDKEYRPDRPLTPHDVRELVQRYPAEVSSVMEEMGLGVVDFWPEILSALGFRKQ